MDVVRSVNGVPIRLTDERWDHIAARHLELAARRSDVLATVEQPTMVLAGVEHEPIACRRFSDGWLLVPYIEESDADGFIVTAFKRKRAPAQSGERLWP